MNKQCKVSRRSALKAASIGALGTLAASPARADEKKELPKFENASFYDAAGKFKLDAAQEAIVSLMKYHGYPIFPGVKEKLWISDYGVGQYAKLGLAAVMFVNNERDRYMLMDIYLLPGQMLPEHWHVKTEKNPAKLEGWLVRHGLSHIVGIGEDNLSKDIVIPKCHCNGTVSVRHEVAATPGTFVPLARVESRHWQLAGPEGAIITEVANVHDNAGVRHSDKVLNDYFLNAK
jgi:D-lyxose ketol-isomerase